MEGEGDSNRAGAPERSAAAAAQSPESLARARRASVTGSLRSRIDIRLAELIMFLLAVVGSIALGLGIGEYFAARPYVSAYLVAYFGFRLADVLIREDLEPAPDSARIRRLMVNQLPVLAIFAAAPLERTYLYGGEPARWIGALGLLIELVGLWLALGARIQLGFFTASAEAPAEATLVRSGLFRYIRHPIYLGEFLVVFAWTVECAAPLTLIATVVLGALIGSRRATLEENALRERFGEEYADYLRRTNRFIPSVW